ncbi:MAG TPA: F0F1 ATP synthase subunit B [Pirellulaceae bacterium]|nr:F0F1 ATP synthase subunit B [Pirellulaceae bacterium]
MLRLNLLAEGDAPVTALDPDLAFFTVVVFGLTFLVLWRFAWKPIAEGLDRRERGIADQIDRAKSDAAKAAETLRGYEAKLSGAAEEATRILAQAKTEAQAAGERILAEARADAEAARTRALADIASAKEQAVRELAKLHVDSAVSLAGSLIRKEVDAKGHQDLIQDSLQRFASRN